MRGSMLAEAETVGCRGGWQAAGGWQARYCNIVVHNEEVGEGAIPFLGDILSRIQSRIRIGVIPWSPELYGHPNHNLNLTTILPQTQIPPRNLLRL